MKSALDAPVTSQNESNITGCPTTPGPSTLRVEDSKNGSLNTKSLHSPVTVEVGSQEIRFRSPSQHGSPRSYCSSISQGFSPRLRTPSQRDEDPQTSKSPSSSQSSPSPKHSITSTCHRNSLPAPIPLGPSRMNRSTTSLNTVPSSPRSIRLSRASLGHSLVRAPSPAKFISPTVRRPSPLSVNRNSMRPPLPLPSLASSNQDVRGGLLMVKNESRRFSSLQDDQIQEKTLAQLKKEMTATAGGAAGDAAGATTVGGGLKEMRKTSSSSMNITSSEIVLMFSDEEGVDEQSCSNSDEATNGKCHSAISSPLFPSKYQHSKQRSDDTYTSFTGSQLSFAHRFGELTIDNSCFDLLATTAENSAVNTPVEKVFPRMFGPDFPGLPLSPSFLDGLPMSPSLLDVVEESHEHSNRDMNSRDANNSFSFSDDHMKTMVAHSTDADNEETEPDSSDLPESSNHSRKQSTLSSSSAKDEMPKKIKDIRQSQSAGDILRYGNDSAESLSAISSSDNSATGMRDKDQSVNPLRPPKLRDRLNQVIIQRKEAVQPSARELTISTTKLVGRQFENLRLIEILRVKVEQIKGLRGSTARPIFILAKLDNKDIYQSTAINRSNADALFEDFSHDIVSNFSHLHLVVLEAARGGKTPRPIGRVSLKRKDIVRNCGKEQMFPLRVVSKFSEVQGQICLDFRRTHTRFSIRVVDYCDLNLREPQELYLLVSANGDKDAKKLKIDTNRSSNGWLDMECEARGTLSLKFSMWREVLRGLNATFLGTVRVDVDDRYTSGPSKWFYLRPKATDPEKKKKDGGKEGTKKETSPLGEMKLWVSYTADHVLPLNSYRPLLAELSKSAGTTTYNASAIAVIESLPGSDLSCIARPLVQIFAFTKEIRSLLKILYLHDISKCQDMNTLFRSQSLASKMLFELMKLYGHQYLLISLKPVIDKIYNDRKCCEIDPSRLGPGESLEKNTEQLVTYFSMCFTRVVESSSRCPHALRIVFADLRKVVGDATNRPECERLALSSFLIMRFFAAAILNPKSFGIKRENPEGRVSRTLVLLSKILQRLANEVVSTQPLSSKEPWLGPILKRVTDEDHRNSMSRFLDKISLQFSDASISSESISVLKDGYLVETKNRGQRRWGPRMMQNTKKRFVTLTDSDISWQKSKRGGITDTKGSFVLSDIDGVTPGDRATFLIKADEKEVAFEASSPIEMDEWVSAIERQRTRARRMGPRCELSDLFDCDVERELEGIHMLLVNNADHMNKWKSALESKTALPEGVSAMPGGCDPEDESCEFAEDLKETLENLLCATYSIETIHSDSDNKYINHIRHGSGTRENPIGDENYLLLKRKLNLFNQ